MKNSLVLWLKKILRLIKSVTNYDLNGRLEFDRGNSSKLGNSTKIKCGRCVCFLFSSVLIKQLGVVNWLFPSFICHNTNSTQAMRAALWMVHISPPLRSDSIRANVLFFCYFYVRKDSMPLLWHPILLRLRFFFLLLSF